MERGGGGQGHDDDDDDDDDGDDDNEEKEEEDGDDESVNICQYVKMKEGPEESGSGGGEVRATWKGFVACGHFTQRDAKMEIRRSGMFLL